MLDYLPKLRQLSSECTTRCGSGVLVLVRKTPVFVKWLLRARSNLPGHDIEATSRRENLQPVWDQHLCLIPDADLYNAITSGRATKVVTDHAIDHFDATGIALKSGGHLDAGIIVTATGLQLQLAGPRSASTASDRPSGCFTSGACRTLPNLFWCVGYTNASGRCAIL